MISLGFAAPWGGIRLLVSNNTTASACTDECITNCATNSTGDCLTQCGCAQFESPTNQDMFTQSACYHKCTKNCLILPTIDERKACMDLCPCECNTFCINQCKKIGLNSTCESNCGCNRPVVAPEATNTTEALPLAAGEVPVDSTSTTQDTTTITPSTSGDSVLTQPEAAAPTIETVPEVVPETEVSSSVVSSTNPAAQIPGTVESTVQPVEASTPQITIASRKQNEVKALFSELIQENSLCDPSCWRGCLQMQAEKKAVVGCVAQCGCARENSQIQQYIKSELKVKNKSSGSILMTLLFLSLMIGGICYFIYKRKFQKTRKLSDDYEDMLSYNNKNYGYQESEAKTDYTEKITCMVSSLKSAFSNNHRNEKVIDDYEEYEKLD